jgi:hypothetical protein
VWIVKSPSPVKSIVIELYRNDYRRSICDTADGSNCNCELYECESKCAINSLDPIRHEVICRVIHPTRGNSILIYYSLIISLFHFIYSDKDSVVK